MKYLKIVYVEWIDSTTEVGWDSETKDKIETTISVGILIKETEDAYVIANSYDPDTQENNGRIYIPHFAIKKARTLCQIQMKTNSAKKLK